MAVSKAKKKEQVEKLSAELKNVSNAVVTTYTKMTVAQDYELRKALRGAGAKYQVVKNTWPSLLRKAQKIEGGLNDLSGVTSIAYTTGDPWPWPRRSRNTPKTYRVHFQGGRRRGPRDFDQRDRSAFQHASKDELMAKLLFLINAPAQRLVTVMNAVGRDRRGRTQPGRGEGQVSRTHRNWAILRLCDFAIENLRCFSNRLIGPMAQTAKW